MVSRIKQAQAAVDAARAVLADLDSLSLASREEVVELLDRTAALSRIVDAQRVRLAAEISDRSTGADEDSICRRLGKHNAKEAVASAFGIRIGAAQALLRLAALTSPTVGVSGGDIPVKYPRVAAALREGEISLPQAQTIVQQLEPAAPRADLDQLAWAEGALVDAATDPDAPLVPELLIEQARAYVAVLDPDGVLPAAERQRMQRSLRMRQTPDGGLAANAYFPPEEGSVFKAFMDAWTGPRVRGVAFRDDADTLTDADRGHRGADSDAGPDSGDGPHRDDCQAASREHLDGACDCGRDIDPDGQVSGDGAGVVDDRTLAQKRHDVLIGVIRAAAGDAPLAGGEPPTLVFTGTIDAYTAYLSNTEHPDRTLTIEHTGAIVPIETVDRLACDGIIHHAIVNATGHVLSLGRTERIFTRAQRRALAARDKGCRVPGCGMPVAWCEAHHIIWWSNGGPTDIDNGILVCTYHHHEIHAGRLIIQKAGPQPGNWRIIPQLRPADRYARNPRTNTNTTPQPAAPPASVMANDKAVPTEPAPGDACDAAAAEVEAAATAVASTLARTDVSSALPGPRSTGALADDAVPSLAFRLPDTDATLTGRMAASPERSTPESRWLQLRSAQDRAAQDRAAQHRSAQDRAAQDRSTQDRSTRSRPARRRARGVHSTPVRTKPVRPTRPPRGRTSAVEARLQQIAGARRTRAARMAAVDLAPPAHIVMRT